jgi:hypothetical protein
MDRNIVVSFCENSEKNPFGFMLVNSTLIALELTIDDFQCSLHSDDSFYHIATEDDFLFTFMNNFNVEKYMSLNDALLGLTTQYGKQYDDSSTPLYHNQDVFELENDNHDLKFVDRVRFKEDDFNFDLFLFIFEFLSPEDIARLQRVSKAFHRIGMSDHLWIKACGSIPVDWLLSPREFYIKYHQRVMVNWDIEYSKYTLDSSNQTTMQYFDHNKSLQVHYEGCYNKIYTNSFDHGVIRINLEVDSNMDDYHHVGVVNENFGWFSCLCLPCANSCYISSGNGNMVSCSDEVPFSFTPSRHPTLSLELDCDNKTFTCDGVSLKIDGGGKDFRFVVGCCNNTGTNSITTYKILPFTFHRK